MLNEIMTYILAHKGHFSFDGTTLEVAVGDYVATVHGVDRDLDIVESYLWPIFLALDSMRLSGVKFDTGSESYKPLEVRYTGVTHAEARARSEDREDMDVLRKLWFALDQHKSDRMLGNTTLNQMRQSMHRAASIFIVGRVVEFEVET